MHDALCKELLWRMVLRGDEDVRVVGGRARCRDRGGIAASKWWCSSVVDDGDAVVPGGIGWLDAKVARIRSSGQERFAMVASRFVLDMLSPSYKKMDGCGWSVVSWRNVM